METGISCVSIFLYLDAVFKNNLNKKEILLLFYSKNY